MKCITKQSSLHAPFKIPRFNSERFIISIVWETFCVTRDEKNSKRREDQSWNQKRNLIEKETGENEVGAGLGSWNTLDKSGKVCGRTSFLYPLNTSSSPVMRCNIAQCKRSALEANQNTRRVRREQELKLNWSYAIGRLEQQRKPTEFLAYVAGAWKKWVQERTRRARERETPPSPFACLLRAPCSFLR